MRELSARARRGAGRQMRDVSRMAVHAYEFHVQSSQSLFPSRRSSNSVRIFSEVSDSVHAAHCAGPSPQSQDVNRAASLCERHDRVAARVVLHLRPHTLLEGGAGAGGSCEETFGECESEDGWSETSADLSRFSRAEAGPSFPIQRLNVSRSCKRTQHRGMLV